MCLALTVLLLLPQSLAPAVIIVEGNCSLVDAINAANGDVAVGGCPAGSGADEIRLTGGVSLTEVDNYGDDGPNVLPQVSSDITIEGNGFTIERNGFFNPNGRIFQVLSNGTLRLNSITISNGLAPYYYGGGIHSSGTLILNDTRVESNTGGHGGGGLFLDTLSRYTALTDSTIVDNRAGNLAHPPTRGGGGILARGGTLVLRRTLLAYNSVYGQYGIPKGTGGLEVNVFIGPPPR